MWLGNYLETISLIGNKQYSRRQSVCNSRDFNKSKAQCHLPVRLF